MADIVHEPIDDEQAEMHIWPPADFSGFGLEHAVPIHPIFLTLPIECRCHTMVDVHSSSHLPVLEYTDGDHCVLMCLNDLHQPPKVFLSLMSKRSSLKREKHFLAVLSPTASSPYTAQMFLAASAAFAPLLNSERRICQKCSNFFTWHATFKRSRLHSLSSNDKTSICKLKHNN